MSRWLWTANPRRQRNAPTPSAPNGNSPSLCKYQRCLVMLVQNGSEGSKVGNVYSSKSSKNNNNRTNKDVSIQCCWCFCEAFNRTCVELTKTVLGNVNTGVALFPFSGCEARELLLLSEQLVLKESLSEMFSQVTFFHHTHTHTDTEHLIG